MYASVVDSSSSASFGQPGVKEDFYGRPDDPSTKVAHKSGHSTLVIFNPGMPRSGRNEEVQIDPQLPNVEAPAFFAKISNFAMIYEPILEVLITDS